MMKGIVKIHVEGRENSPLADSPLQNRELKYNCYFPTHFKITHEKETKETTTARIGYRFLITV